MIQNYSPQILKYIKPEVLEKIKLRQFTVPQAVSVTKDPTDETEEQTIKRQEDFLNLSEVSQDKLVSEETSQKIQQIGQTFNLQLLQMADISRAIRSYYFGEIKLEDIAPVLAREIPIDIMKAREIARMVIEKIINDNSQEQAYQSRLEIITLQNALKNYPELGEQLVTNEKIALKTFHESVRPSIKNWLADYTFTMGYEYKSAIERGNYLFQSINGRRLNSLERQKLSYLLKAHDENSTVTINKDSKQLIFPASDIEPAKTSPSQVPNPKPVMQNTGKIAASRSFSPNNGGLPRNDSYKISQLKDSNIKFSSPQKLPYEKETAPTTPAYKPTKPEPMRIKPHTEINDNYFSDRNSGKPLNNVVNLKEE